MRAARHERLDAVAKLVHAHDKIVEREHDAFRARDRSRLVEHARHAGIGPDQRAHVEVHRVRLPGHPACRRPGIGRGVSTGLKTEVGQRPGIGALHIPLPLGERGIIRLVGDHHHQRIAADIAPRLRDLRQQPLIGDGVGGRGIEPRADAEIVVGERGGELHAACALTGADQWHRPPPVEDSGGSRSWCRIRP